MNEENKRNYEVYLNKMEKAMQSKLFFLNYIDIDSYDYVVDFGCSNGELLSRLNISDSKKIGIDISKEMRERFKSKLPNSHIFSNLIEVSNFLKSEKDKKILLILSSVLHEIENEKDRLFILMFIYKYVDTVCVRDMVKPDSNCDSFLYNKFKIINSVIKDSDSFVAYKWAVNRGKIDNLEDLSEYLLKMDYVENYDLEINEHYFSADLESFQKALEKPEIARPFETVHQRTYAIPPMVEKLTKYGLPYFRTHMELIMKRI